MQTQYETLSLINGRVHTQSSIASNITLEHGRIVAIDNDVSAIEGKVIDLHGRTVLPGFCDTDFDLLSWAENQERFSLSNTRSAKEFIAALKTYQQTNSQPLRGWYIAYGLPDSLIISHEEIDSAISSMPCAVINSGNTHAVLNTAAMTEFNMPQDNVELEEFTKHIPDLSRDDILYLVKTYALKINALGITEIWGNFRGNPEDLWRIFLGDAHDSLTFRLRCNFSFDDVLALNNFLASGLRTGDGLPLCKMGGIIVNENLKQEEQKNIITSAHLSGCQIIGSGNQYCLNALERVSKRFRKSSRHLIRCNNFTSKHIDRMRLLELGGISSGLNEDNSLHEAFLNGIVISAGSGNILKSPAKFIGDLVCSGLSAAEALSFHTWSASWNGSNEQRRGELALGNDADIVVLEQDPFLVKPEEISKIDTAMTICAGNIVYDSGTI